MQLFQLLRMIDDVTPIVLLDMNQKVLFQGFKKNISVDYYEYSIFKLYLDIVSAVGQSWSALHIMLIK